MTPDRSMHQTELHPREVTILTWLYGLPAGSKVNLLRFNLSDEALGIARELVRIRELDSDD